MVRGRRVLLAGTALLVLLPAVPATAHPGPGPSTYAWVDPPAGIEGGGAAQARRVTVGEDLLAKGRADVWTPDLQALVTLAAAPPVAVEVVPRDPTAWPSPDGLEVSGNAYEVHLDGEVDDAVTVLRPPHLVTHVARWDGAAWDVDEAVPGAEGEVRVPWDGPGPYVAAARRLDGHGSALGAVVHDRWRVLLLAGGVGGLVLGLRRRAARQER